MNQKENRLIVLLLKNEINSEEREETVNVISRKPAWDYILSKSIELDLAPIVYFHLKTLSKNYPELLELIPNHILEELKKHYYINTVKNKHLFEELNRIFNSCNEAGVPIIVLKGGALAELFYQNRGLRQMFDIDILVKEGQLKQAEEIIRDLGYSPRLENVRPETYYRNHHHHLPPYLSEDKLVHLDIHNNLIPKSITNSIDLSRVWSRAHRVVIAGTDAMTLCPEDMLLHLCLHVSLADTFLGKLKGLCDISQIIRRYKTNLDWDQILSESIEFRIENYMYYTLWIVKKLLSNEIPDEVLDHLKRNKSTRYIEDKVLKNLISEYVFETDQSRNFIPLGIIRSFLKKLLQDTRRANIFITFAVSIIETFNDSITSKYQGRKLIPIYALLHLVGVFSKYSWIKIEKK
jgi:hypothetical protein